MRSRLVPLERVFRFKKTELATVDVTPRNRKINARPVEIQIIEVDESHGDTMHFLKKNLNRAIHLRQNAIVYFQSFVVKSCCGDIHIPRMHKIKVPVVRGKGMSRIVYRTNISFKCKYI